VRAGFGGGRVLLDIQPEKLEGLSRLILSEKVTCTDILTPIAMTNTTLLVKDANARLLTTVHVLNSTDNPVVSKVFPYNRVHSPSSNLHSNVADMLRWAVANINRGELDGNHMAPYPRRSGRRIDWY
jgi:CubicO group peptidase (beta-lactamase class C family)